MKKALTIFFAILSIPLEIVVSTFVGFLCGIGNAFESLEEIITGEFE